MIPLPRLVFLFTSIQLLLLLGMGYMGNYQTQRAVVELDELLHRYRPLVEQLDRAEDSLHKAQSLLQFNLYAPPISAALPAQSLQLIEQQLVALNHRLSGIGSFNLLDINNIRRAHYFTQQVDRALSVDASGEETSQLHRRAKTNLDRFQQALLELQQQLSMIPTKEARQALYLAQRLGMQALEVDILLKQIIEQPPMFGREVANYLKQAQDALKGSQRLAEQLGLTRELEAFLHQIRRLYQLSLMFYEAHAAGDHQADSVLITQGKIQPLLHQVFWQLSKIQRPLQEIMYATEAQTLEHIESRAFNLAMVISLGIVFGIFSALAMLTIFQRRGQPMIAAANALKQGDFSHRIRMPSRDFLQSMADAFNNMAETLQRNDIDIRRYTSELDEARQKLEQRVRERTAELENSQRKLTRLAFYDPLTGLPNRALFHERLQQQLSQARRHGHYTGVMFLDLDKFKLINDNYGHNVGDELLQTVAKRISDCFKRECDTVARLSGDEFTVLLPEVDSRQSCIHMAEAILAQFAQPIQLGDLTVMTSPSIGIAMAPDHGDDMFSLLKNADTAMYKAKQDGRNRYRFFDPAMSEQNKEELALLDAMRLAIRNQEFVVHYQPKINAVTGHIDSFEALVRWHHPTLGVILPERFIPLAEENGDILALGDWVLHQACRQVGTWGQQFGLDLGVAVNLSPEQLKDPKLPTKISAALADSGLPPARLELEITEHSALGDLQLTREVLHQLRQLGTTIALDDFGTGYASLSYLKQLPIDTLKVDRSFVHRMCQDLEDEAIVSAVAVLARQLGLNLVAEGVEQQAHVQRLQELGFDQYQGYFFNGALPAEEVIALLAHQQAA